MKKTIAFLFVVLLSVVALRSDASPPLGKSTVTAQSELATGAATIQTTIHQSVLPAMTTEVSVQQVSAYQNDILYLTRGSTIVPAERTSFRYHGLLSYTRILKARSVMVKILRC